MGTSSNWQNNCTSTHFICNASDRHSFTSPFIHPWLSPLWLLSHRIHNTCFVIIPSALHNRTLKQRWVKRWKENGDLPLEKEEEDNEGKVEDIRGGPWWEWKAGRGLGTGVHLTKFFCNKRQSDCHRRLFFKAQVRLYTVHLNNPHFCQVEALVAPGTYFWRSSNLPPPLG